MQARHAAAQRHPFPATLPPFGRAHTAGCPVPVSTLFAGYLLSGKKFDSSYNDKGEGKPFGFRLGKNKVILGWEAIVSGMREGQKVIVKIPARFAYGDKGAGGGFFEEAAIPPNSDLVFYMELNELGNIKR